MDLDTGNISVSKNVNFHELHFPYHMISAGFNKSTLLHSIFLPSITTPLDDNDYSPPPLSTPDIIKPTQSTDPIAHSSLPVVRQSTRTRVVPSYL